MIFSYLKQDGITKISIWVVMIFSYQEQNLVREFYSLACYGFSLS